MLPIWCFWSPPWIDFSISRFPPTYCQFALPPILQIYLLVVTKLECHINSTTLDAFSDYWPPIPNEFYKIVMIWLDYMQSLCCSKWLCASKKCQPLKCKIIAICNRLFYSCVKETVTKYLIRRNPRKSLPTYLSKHSNLPECPWLIRRNLHFISNRRGLLVVEGWEF